MEKPIWILKDKEGNEVWSSSHIDYVLVIETALQELGYQLIWGDLEVCPGCRMVNAFCVCPDPAEREPVPVSARKEGFEESERRSGSQPNAEFHRRRTDNPNHNIR